MVGETVVTMCLFNRPSYTLAVVKSILSAKYCGDYLYRAVVDPSPATDRILARLNYLSKAGLNLEVHVNKERLGCNANTFEALDKGFAKSERVIHIEDDTVIAPDFFEWAEFCFAAFQNDLSVFSWSGYSRHLKDLADYNPSMARKYCRNTNFVCWGWGSWRDRWEEVREQWAFENGDADQLTAWDTKLSRNLNGGRKHVFPFVSRVKNIGESRGTYNPSREWHKDNVALSAWSGDIEPEEMSWSELV